MHALVSLGTTIQLRRENKIKIGSELQLVRICDLVGEIDPQILHAALIGTWLKPTGDGFYSMPVWDEWNKQLKSAWANGDKKKHSTELKRTEGNRTELNRTELERIEEKRIELDATATLGATLKRTPSDARSDASSKRIQW